MALSGLGADMIYRSPRPTLNLPPEPYMDMVTFMLNNTRDAYYADRLALVDASTGETLTFSQMTDQIRRVAQSLVYLDIHQNDVVLILSRNCVCFAVVFFAIVSLGAVVTAANPVNTENEIAKQMKDSAAKLVLTTPELLEKVKNSGRPLVLMKGARPPLQRELSIYLLSELMDRAHVKVPDVRIRQTDTAALLYSSGTTGTSKGVVLSHRNFIASALQVNAEADYYNVRDDVYLCVVPMFHVYGLSIVVYGQLQRGSTVVSMPKYDLVEMLETIQKYRITNLPLVPPIMIALAKYDGLKKYDLSSVKEITSGAAPLGKETLEDIYRQLRIQDVRQGYGMTETTGIISIPLLRSKPVYGTTGPLVSDIEAVIVDQITNNRLPFNQQGELWLRGPNITQGYFNNPEATALTLDKDGWLRTGDVVSIDDEGNLCVRDRLKELIKYKGLQVVPAELEALLITHSQILDAAVVPLPDETAGEVPLAFIVRAASSSLSESDVIQFVASKVAPYKKVRKVKFVNRIPKSVSGKILRRELIQQITSKL
eukprot:c21477_g1_i1 orf=361-1983(+)